MTFEGIFRVRVKNKERELKRRLTFYFRTKEKCDEFINFFKNSLEWCKLKWSIKEVPLYGKAERELLYIEDKSLEEIKNMYFHELCDACFLDDLF